MFCRFWILFLPCFRLFRQWNFRHLARQTEEVVPGTLPEGQEVVTTKTEHQWVSNSVPVLRSWHERSIQHNQLLCVMYYLFAKGSFPWTLNSTAVNVSQLAGKIWHWNWPKNPAFSGRVNRWPPKKCQFALPFLQRGLFVQWYMLQLWESCRCCTSETLKLRGLKCKQTFRD